MRAAVIPVALLLGAFAESGWGSEIAGWDVHSDLNGGLAAGCSAVGPVQNGVQIGVTVDRRFQWMLSISRTDWTLSPNDTTELSASVDRRILVRGDASNIAKSALAISIEGSARYTAIENGRELEVKSSLGDFSVNLAGAGPALSSLLECVRAANEVSASTSAGAPPGQAQQSHAVSFAEASVMLTNLLNSAGVQGYRLQPPTAGTAGVQYTLADGTTGRFEAFKDQTAQAVEDQVGAVIARLVQLCQGDFRSAKTSIPTDNGSLVRKIGTTCATNSFVVATNTTLIRHPNGFVVELIEISSYQSSGLPNATSNDQRPSALVTAAMQLLDSQH